MYTWRRGMAALEEKTAKLQVPLDELFEMLERSPPHRSSGIAVFLSSDPDNAPTALMHNVKHNRMLHERNVVLKVEYAETPRVSPDQRMCVEAALA